tara:strand:- start:11769 stop:12224 length:456 start_codon:yes stop_codon:yes gene_type:complete
MINVEGGIMKIKEAMTTDVEYLSEDSSLHEAAQCMLKHDCGFLPVSNKDKSKLLGVLTDRDITIRGVAKGLDPEKTCTRNIMSEDVWYCFSEYDISSAVDSMRNKGVYRLVVLDNREDKNLCGVISLGDIYRHNEKVAASSAADEIMHQAA